MKFFLFFLGLCQQLIPVVGWMTALQHLAKHAVGIVATVVGALGVVVIDPGEHDHFSAGVVPKKEAILLEKLCAKPMLAFIN